MRRLVLIIVVSLDLHTESATQANAVTEFVRIAGGTFTMGSPANEAGRRSDETQHQVTVRSFYMANRELTVGEFRAFVNNTGYRTDAERSGGGWVLVRGRNWQMRDHASWDNLDFSQAETHPVVLVTWYDAVTYANWRSAREGLTPAYTITGSGDGRRVVWDRSANGYRLPTEAEWEYAARAGTTGAFSTGENITTDQANYDGTSPYNNNPSGVYRRRTTATGRFAPNAWGLYDMHGNAFEWCWDWYAAYGTEEQIDPTGPSTGTNRVYRGGSWGQGGELLRSAYRRNNSSTSRSDGLGFRLARNAE
jgi:formylglycine-generating enzyme